MDRLKQLESTLKPSPKMPVLFVGHGNPMNAISDNSITQEWQRVGAKLPAAQAIVVISAHWLTYGTRITDAPKQRIIYDFYGFPEELYGVQYDASGDPAIAETLRRAFLQYEAQLDSTWGLDHGTWSVLKHLAPDPTIPVLQISLDVRQSLEELVEMFRLLRPLREQGVIFIGSGNIVHNLGIMNFTNPQAFDWALEFDDTAATAMSNHNLGQLVRPFAMGAAARLAIPTDDHYRPMLAAMTLLDPTEDLNYFNEVVEMGSIGMRSFIAS